MKRRTLFSWLFGGAAASIAKEVAPGVRRCDTPGESATGQAELYKDRMNKMTGWQIQRQKAWEEYEGEFRIVRHFSQKALNGGREIILVLGVLVATLFLSSCLPLNWVRPTTVHPAPIEGASDKQPTYYPGSRECGSLDNSATLPP